ncbi:MAG: M48 family metallopeptidase [Candidatus Pacebacteria bacterium]|nr:M48 family metallopeptidase [Candidatus Paceibacterota bacterium]MDD5356642.1 M48 family metallopeptidase [Candidatus Paceibacterota bacterium]
MEISILGEKVEIQESSRARHLRVIVEVDGKVRAVMPVGYSERKLAAFFEEVRPRIEKKVLYFQKRKHKIHIKSSRADFLRLKKSALALAISRLEHFNQFYNFKYKKVSIRNQKTRWGSASRKGNLQFNYKIALLPPEHRDYIIVHELCHLGEFNHSRAFWALVAKQIPRWKELRKSLH